VWCVCVCLCVCVCVCVCVGVYVCVCVCVLVRAVLYVFPRPCLAVHSLVVANPVRLHFECMLYLWKSF
jgi:hypothetical protein